MTSRQLHELPTNQIAFSGFASPARARRASSEHAHHSTCGRERCRDDELLHVPCILASRAFSATRSDDAETLVTFRGFGRQARESRGRRAHGAKDRVGRVVPFEPRPPRCALGEASAAGENGGRSISVGLDASSAEGSCAGGALLVPMARAMYPCPFGSDFATHGWCFLAWQLS